MPKFRSKPTEIEAWRYTEMEVAPDWLRKAVSDGDVVARQNYDEGCLELRLTTVQGQWVYAKPGEWIIRENVEGRFYPCADDVFQQHYEAV